MFLLVELLFFISRTPQNSIFHISQWCLFDIPQWNCHIDEPIQKTVFVLSNVILFGILVFQRKNKVFNFQSSRIKYKRYCWGLNSTRIKTPFHKIRWINKPLQKPGSQPSRNRIINQLPWYDPIPDLIPSGFNSQYRFLGKRTLYWIARIRESNIDFRGPFSGKPNDPQAPSDGCWVVSWIE